MAQTPKTSAKPGTQQRRKKRESVRKSAPVTAKTPEGEKTSKEPRAGTRHARLGSSRTGTCERTRASNGHQVTPPKQEREFLRRRNFTGHRRGVWPRKPAGAGRWEPGAVASPPAGALAGRARPGSGGWGSTGCRECRCWRDRCRHATVARHRRAQPRSTRKAQPRARAAPHTTEPAAVRVPPGEQAQSGVLTAHRTQHSSGESQRPNVLETTGSSSRRCVLKNTFPVCARVRVSIDTDYKQVAGPPCS